MECINLLTSSRVLTNWWKFSTTEIAHCVSCRKNYRIDTFFRVGFQKYTEDILNPFYAQPYTLWKSNNVYKIAKNRYTGDLTRIFPTAGYLNRSSIPLNNFKWNSTNVDFLRRLTILIFECNIPNGNRYQVLFPLYKYVLSVLGKFLLHKQGYWISFQKFEIIFGIIRRLFYISYSRDVKFNIEFSIRRIRIDSAKKKKKKKKIATHVYLPKR